MTTNDFKRSTDSYLTHFFARPISRHLTIRLSSTAATPLQVTLVGFAIALLASCISVFSSWFFCVVAALLLETAHILDCVDGDLARLTGRGNPFAAALDPITDRAKDSSLVYASFYKANSASVLNLSSYELFFATFCALSFWLIYVYIVDTFLNPARAQLKPKDNESKQILYFGLYDFFVYGSILFLLLNVFEYFIFYVLFISLSSVFVQLYRLKSTYDLL